jgi:uncharacterized membrane protein
MKKMDEMGLNINLKGIKWSWLFLVVSLFIWGIYEYVKTQETSLPLILFTLQFLVYFFVTNIAKWKVEDESGKKSMGWYFGGVLFFIIIFGIILYLVMGR